MKEHFLSAKVSPSLHRLQPLMCSLTRHPVPFWQPPIKAMAYPVWYRDYLHTAHSLWEFRLDVPSTCAHLVAFCNQFSEALFSLCSRALFVALGGPSPWGFYPGVAPIAPPQRYLCGFFELAVPATALWLSHHTRVLTYLHPVSDSLVSSDVLAHRYLRLGKRHDTSPYSKGFPSPSCASTRRLLRPIGVDAATAVQYLYCLLVDARSGLADDALVSDRGYDPSLLTRLRGPLTMLRHALSQKQLSAFGYDADSTLQTLASSLAASVTVTETAVAQLLVPLASPSPPPSSVAVDSPSDPGVDLAKIRRCLFPDEPPLKRQRRKL